jgi:Trk K+ transport system NAD-binding subunit
MADKDFRVKNGIYVGTDAYISNSITSVNTVNFATSGFSGGNLAWNTADGTLDIAIGYGDVVLQTGQETHYVVRNASGSTILNGTSVYCDGVTEGSGRLTANLMLGNGSISPVQYLGLATHNINNGVNGIVTYFGYVRDLDTRGTANTAISVGDENWSVGDKLYVHPTAPGKLTKVEPEAPNSKICVAVVIVRNQSAGKLFVRPTTNLSLDKLQDVAILDGILDGQSLVWVSANSRFENKSQTGDEANLYNTYTTLTANDYNSYITLTANIYNTFAYLDANTGGTDNNAWVNANDYSTLLAAQANDYATFLAASANDGATLLSARANDYSTFLAASSNDYATLLAAQSNDGATLLSAQANDYSTFLAASSNDYTTLLAAQANDYSSLLAAQANDYGTYTTLQGEFAANDYSTFLAAQANDYTTHLQAQANDYATLLQAQSNDGATLLSAQANDYSTFLAASSNDYSTYLQAQSNDYGTYTTLQSEFAANDYSTYLQAQSNDYSTYLQTQSNDFNSYTTLEANIYNTFAYLNANVGGGGGDVSNSWVNANDYNSYLTLTANIYNTFAYLNANVGGGGGGSASNTFSDIFTTSDSSNTYILSQSVSEANNILVSLNGIVQYPVIAYEVSGNTLSLANTSPIPNGSNLEVRYLSGGGGGVADTSDVANLAFALSIFFS